MTGISLTFMAVDIAGGVFSILSLAFKEKFDVFASVSYAVIVASYASSFVRTPGFTTPHSILCIRRLWMELSWSQLSS